MIHAAKSGTIEIVSTVVLLTELRNVLWRDKFARRLAQQGFTSDRLFSDYMAVVTIVAPALITPTIARDPSDDALLAAALGAGADLIVSGDAHLRNLKSFHGIEIVTATMADNRINTGG
ncbi:MAG TPA: putative toxin-antitoxin system toxin component, PIN family [Acetobacteraceae bacterium]|nr:putative toxin-antitoxin system toxin component, PIN family [Acetobacteraceae bacterium]